jgi:hypothetical protein
LLLAALSCHILRYRYQECHCFYHGRRLELRSCDNLRFIVQQQHQQHQQQVYHSPPVEEVLAQTLAAAQDDHDALEILHQRSPLPVSRGGVVSVSWWWSATTSLLLRKMTNALE